MLLDVTEGDAGHGGVDKVSLGWNIRQGLFGSAIAQRKDHAQHKHSMPVIWKRANHGGHAPEPGGGGIGIPETVEAVPGGKACMESGAPKTWPGTCDRACDALLIVPAEPQQPIRWSGSKFTSFIAAWMQAW